MSEPARLFSVVIPSRGEPAKLDQLLDALALQTLPPSRFEIILALDGEALAPPLLARLEALGGTLVRLERRLGPGAARNAGTARAHAEFLAFTEDDVTPAPTWLERAALRLESAPPIDVLVGHTSKPSQRSVEVPASDLPLYLPTNLFVRRTLFERVGGYSEEFFAAGTLYFREDSDFGFTLEEAGARIAREPGVLVTHPVEHVRWLDPLRWARRYELDALLAARHPQRFRERIEVQRLGPLRVRRPVVRACVACVVATLAALVAWLAGAERVALTFAVIAALAFLPVWAKWRFNPLRLPVVLLVPFVMVYALLRGQLRIRRRAGASTRSRPETPVPRSAPGS